MTLSLCNASRADASILAALHGAYFPRAWSETEFLGFFEREGIVAYLGIADSEPIAFIFCWAVAGECELLSLAVTPPHRGQGIASRLCEHAFADAKALGAQKVHLEVAASNLAAQSLYQSLGFKMIHRRKDYYRNADGTREDALTMRLSL